MRHAGHFNAGMAQSYALKLRALLDMSKVVSATLKPIRALRLPHAGFIERSMIWINIVATRHVNHATRQVALLHCLEVTANVGHRINQPITPVIELTTLFHGLGTR